jgi:hypothetical protein
MLQNPPARLPTRRRLLGLPPEPAPVTTPNPSTGTLVPSNTAVAGSVGKGAEAQEPGGPGSTGKVKGARDCLIVPWGKRTFWNTCSNDGHTYTCTPLPTGLPYVGPKGIPIGGYCAPSRPLAVPFFMPP